MTNSFDNFQARALTGALDSSAFVRAFECSHQMIVKHAAQRAPDSYVRLHKAYETALGEQMSIIALLRHVLSNGLLARNSSARTVAILVTLVVAYQRLNAAYDLRLKRLGR